MEDKKAAHILTPKRTQIETFVFLSLGSSFFFNKFYVLAKYNRCNSLKRHKLNFHQSSRGFFDKN